MNMRIGIIVGLLMTLLLPGCTWVKLSEGGYGVVVAEAADVGSCRLVGKTRSITKADVASIKRNPEKVAKETETIARNEAAHMNGNTIVKTGNVTEGEQEFMVYECN